MTDNNASIDRFLSLALLKGQLEEIHYSLETDLLSKVVLDRKQRLEVEPGSTKLVVVKLHVTNVGGAKPQKLAIEELTRLRTLVESLQSTINYMHDISTGNGLPPEGAKP